MNERLKVKNENDFSLDDLSFLYKHPRIRLLSSKLKKATNEWTNLDGFVVYDYDKPRRVIKKEKLSIFKRDLEEILKNETISIKIYLPLPVSHLLSYVIKNHMNDATVNIVNYTDFSIYLLCKDKKALKSKLPSRMIDNYKGRSIKLLAGGYEEKYDTPPPENGMRLYKIIDTMHEGWENEIPDDSLMTTLKSLPLYKHSLCFTIPFGMVKRNKTLKFIEMLECMLT